MRVGRLGPVGALLLAGCAAAPPPAIRWHDSLDSAIAEARREGRPIYVLSLFGDLSKKC